MNLCEKLETLVGLQTSGNDTSVKSNVQGPIQYFCAGNESSLGEDNTGVNFFDGHATVSGRYYHSHFGTGQPFSIVRESLEQADQSGSGVFVAGKIATTPQGTKVSIITDWCGQYPVYYWTSSSRCAVSNSILMMEAVTGAGRNIFQGVANLASMGGLWKRTHLEGVQRLDVGHRLQLDARNGLTVRTRSDHRALETGYDDTIRRARKEIQGHLNAVVEANPEANFISDVTGGGDSRAVVSFLERQDSFDYRVRTTGQYPNPDANISAYLMELLGRQSCVFPTPKIPNQIGVRQNAAVSGGAREAGLTAKPFGIEDLVLFRGSFGELGGANAGFNYIMRARSTDPNASFGDALELLFQRKWETGHLRYLTRDAVEWTRAEEISTYSQLENQGYEIDRLFAERYIRVKCRSHFGLSSVTINRNCISPDLLANRWVVEARRSLNSDIYEKAKIIFDLISLSGRQDILFAPMATRRWHPKIVPANLKPAYEKMQSVSMKSENLTDRTGSLYQVHSVDTNEYMASDMIKLPKIKALDYDGVIPQTRAYNLHRSFLAYFLENISPANEVWDYFDRSWIEKLVSGINTEKKNQFYDTLGMGIVASSLSWRFHLEIAPRVQRTVRYSDVLAE